MAGHRWSHAGRQDLRPEGSVRSLLASHRTPLTAAWGRGLQQPPVFQEGLCLYVGPARYALRLSSPSPQLSAKETGATGWLLALWGNMSSLGAQAAMTFPCSPHTAKQLEHTLMGVGVLRCFSD